MEGLIAVGAIALLLIIVVAFGFRMVQQGETVVIERLGRYHRSLDSGINIIMPILDRPRAIRWRYFEETSQGASVVRTVETAKIDLREQVYDFPKQNVITKDNVMTEINAMLYFQITDAMKAIYEIADLPNAIEKLTQTSLRNVVGEMDLDELLSSRDTVNQKLRKILDEATDKWGVKVNRVEIQDIMPPPNVQKAMEQQMQAERAKRAAVLEAEGKKQSAILEAEGQRQSAVARAEGDKKARVLSAEAEAEARTRVAEAEAEAIKMVAGAVKEDGASPTAYLLGVQYIDALRGLGEGQSEKVVYLPYEATALLSSLGGIKDLFQTTDGARRAPDVAVPRREPQRT